MKAVRQPVDRVFLALILGELLFGLIMLASASGPLSYHRLNNGWYYISHQIIAGVVPGLLGMWFFARMDSRRFERYALPVFGLSLALLCLVFVPGVAAKFGTSKSWIMIGGWFSFQPIEFFKLAFIVYVAAVFAKEKRQPGEAFLPAALALGVGGVLLMMQPDLGGMVLVTMVFLTMIFAGGVPLYYFAGLVLLGAGGFIAFAKAAAYRAARLTVFLHPELDPQGIGYQINQALLAIGSGGFWGLGYGHSRQKYSYLPEVMNDSIFPIVAEELGFVLSLGIIILVGAIFWRGVAIARGCRDRFGRLAAIGIVSWLFFQSVFNIGAMLGLLPLTGLPLPFVSYGGTSMAITLWSAGVVLSISRGTGRG